MKMEIPDEAEEYSTELIGSLTCLRDLIAGLSPELNRDLGCVRSADMGCLIQMIQRQAVAAHVCKFGPIAPKASNND